ncbi:rho GTPase-activating protein 26-like isoform X2 [Styela clava]|uniref:rho GTPase-activating protein 26-like isoform X2 n=1 Tax=Styela clava TaxID=7725 RepID=UPI00193AA90F|nr:rho GTPase-activating protein 26-like isoform X2 [Styela clava]
MVLHPLEFSECFLDSPWFRQSIKEYEDELERTNSQIKSLIKDAKAMLQASRKQGETMQAFSERLKKFQFEIIGENLTDTERGIAGSLKEFGMMLEEIEEEWTRTIERSELQLIQPLEKFRKEHIHGYRDAKKGFDKASERYYKQMEQTLGLSHKKKENLLSESDNELGIQKKNFHSSSLNYVYKLQEVQERKKFEFVEHLLMFMQVYFNFFHQTHETAFDCKEYMNDIQMRLVSTRSQYDGTRNKTQSLMRKMMDNPNSSMKNAGGNSSPHRVIGQRWARAGYLLLLEKNALGSRFPGSSKWSRYFCMYTKENKLFQMLPPFNQSSSSSSNASTRSINHHGSVAVAVDPLIVLSCVRRITDSIDKRFCFDIEVEDSTGKQATLTLQATSTNDRKKWLAVMDGREPNYITAKEYKKPEEFDLNETSIKFVKDVIEEIERRGVNAEGIYRLVGVSSKVDRLLQIVMDPQSYGDLNYKDEIEWELNTLTSALKSFFRNLPEPIMTFNLHEEFIAAAKHEDPDERLNRVISLVAKLSSDSQHILEMLIRHLQKVAARWEESKMTVQNIGVCFGPTLMRPKQETVQSIMEIKFNNIIVEILIENYAAIFGRSSNDQTTKERRLASPKPTVDSRPSMRLGRRPRQRTVVKATIIDGDLLHPTSQQDPNTKFQRGHAIRGVPGRPLSPRSQRRIADNEDGSLSSSDNNTDEFGRISPLDLNLDMDHFSINRSSSPSNSNQTHLLSNASEEERTTKEEWKIDRKAPQRTTSSRGAQKTMGSVGSHLLNEHSNKNPTYNYNQNNANRSNSALPDSTSVQKRKQQLLIQTVRKMHPPPIAPKNVVLRRPPPIQGSHSVDHEKNHNNVSQRPSSIDFEKLLEKFSSPNDKKTVTASNAISSKPDSADDRDMSFLWPKPGSLKSNSYVEASMQSESRPRSTVVSSRDELIKTSNASSPTSPSNSGISKVDIPASPTAVPKRPRTFITLYACEAEHESELSFVPDQVLYDVKESDEPGWLIGTLDGVKGLIPENYVRERIVL